MEAEPTERVPFQQVPDLEQVTGWEFQLQERCASTVIPVQGRVLLLRRCQVSLALLVTVRESSRGRHSNRVSGHW